MLLRVPLLLALLPCCCAFLATFRAAARRKAFLSASDDVNVAVEAVEEASLIRAVPIINTASLNISVSNPFSFAVTNVNAAREELHQILTSGSITEPFHHYRIEYLTKVLESTYIPIQTIPFMNFALSGDWSLSYSNVLTPRADPTLTTRIFQQISPDYAVYSGAGNISNSIQWKLDRPGDQSSGDLVINCQYKITSKGDLEVSLQEHVLLPIEGLPNDVEDLILTMQRSIPFEFFDPDQTLMSNTYVDPEIRITRVSGEKFYGVFNIFLKDAGGPIPASGSSSSSQQPPEAGRRGSV